jgi:N-formylglutamate deformylase
MIPLIAHIPHSHTAIPADLRPAFRLSDAQFQKEIFRLTDWYADELFVCVQEMGGVEVAFPLSRLVLDPERFEDDAQEIMASRGIGDL